MNEREFLKALRTGSVPREGLGAIFVGHEKPLEELLRELDDVRAGMSSIRFVQGEYGSGKTMLTSYLLERALASSFCVSQIVIDPNVQLGNFSQVYGAFCSGIRTPGSGDGSGLASILEEWSRRQLHVFLAMEGLNGADLDARQIAAFRSHIETELISVRNLNPSLARAISAFAGGKLKKDSDLWKFALNWIRANDTIVSKDYAQQLGLRGRISADDAFSCMKGVLFLVRETGYGGTVVLLDEVETVRRLPNPAQRKKAYEILRHIVDDVSSGQFANTFFLITATPDFFTGRKGISEYEALEKRIQQFAKNEEGGSHRQPVLALRALRESDLGILAARLREIHGAGEEWNIAQRVSDEALKQLVVTLAAGFGGVTESDPRHFIRQLIDKFDVLKENPGKSVEDLLSAVGPSRG